MGFLTSHSHVLPLPGVPMRVACHTGKGRGAGKALILQTESWSSGDSNSFFPGEFWFYHLAVVGLSAVTTEECVNETNQDKDALRSRVFKF